MRGGAAVAASAGIPVPGGHSVCDNEPKYGMTVTGRVDLAKIWRKEGLIKGAVLILTKALGTGAISRAIRRRHARPEVVASAVASMTRLNREAAACAASGVVYAWTDITGFGIAGHLTEMCAASRARVELDLATVPVLPGALELLATSDQPAANAANWRYVEPLFTAAARP